MDVSTIKNSEEFWNDFRLWYKTTVKEEIDEGKEVSYTLHEYINVVQFPNHLKEQEEERILNLNDEEVTAELLYLTDINAEIIKDHKRGY